MASDHQSHFDPHDEADAAGDPVKGAAVNGASVNGAAANGTAANGTSAGRRKLVSPASALMEHPQGVGGRIEKGRPPALSAPPSPAELARALQRRWVLALVLAVCCAIPPAVAAWYFVPVEYSAASWLRARNGVYMFKTKIDTQTSLSTHQAWIKSPLVLNAALGKPGVAQLPTIREQTEKGVDEADWLGRQIRVNVGRNDEYLVISMTGERPKDVAHLVNSVTDAYLQQVVGKERSDALRKRDSLERTFRDKNAEIHRRLERLAGVARQLGTADTDTAKIKQELLMDYTAQLHDDHNKLRGLASEKERQINLFERFHNIGEDGVPPISKELLETYAAQDPEVMEYRKTLDIKREQLVGLRGVLRNPEEQPRFQGKQREMQELRDQADAREREIYNELVKQRDANELQSPLQAEYEKLKTELEHLKSEQQTALEMLTEYSAEIKAIGGYSSSLEAEKAELERMRRVVGEIGMELERVAIELSEGSRVELMEPATVPKTVNTKKRDSMTALGGLGGIALALLGVAFFEFHARRITNFTAIEDGLGVRVMGDVPLLTGKRWSLLGGVNGVGALQGMMDESIDGVRSMLLHLGTEESVRCVLVTSAKAGEGKTTVASSLAASMGRSGRRTLLVDGDLRRPSVHRLLDVPNRAGFCEVLGGEAAVADVVRPTRSPGLWVMTAGQCNPESLQALAREGVAHVFKELREQFDFVVVDSGPVLAVVDPLLLGPYTDGAIISVVRRASQMSAVYETCERLDGVGVRVLGSVVNGTNTGRFGFDYYGYGYGYGYGHGYDNGFEANGHYEEAEYAKEN